ncbi:putative component of the cytosolic iron-sulfur (Fe-S) protein assembly (CIA) machinery [Lyophyllum shimeji]|uniref:NADPH-dependent diflavin oxidoreductase 1 n=1 Tax=Lyophyllum shimeji TaxID=47721 RepID=A0A9P3UUC0_LYOSH|nr:putative component of the cytosolic iron-sulfur (Fe-S) protein assembly (CIA) machinery [Lyophyllum shimeji]
MTLTVPPSPNPSPEPDPRSLLILYATETGNAQDVADRVARHCRRIAFQCRVVSAEAFSAPELLSEPLVVFVVSTTGSGVEPRSMSAFWAQLLRADLPPDLFEDLSFAVFGLGDSAYEKFNWAAKKLSRRLASLGAHEIVDRGEGDDQHPLGLDGAFQPWSERLIAKLVELHPLPPGVEVIPETSIPPPRVAIDVAPETEAERKTGEPETDDLLEADKAFHTAVVRENTRLTAEGWYQDVRHLEFEFDGRDNIQYAPGDVALIHPVFPAAEVQDFLEILHWDDIADTPITITRTMEDQTLPDHLPLYPQRTTLRTLIARHVDFRAVPRRSFFQYLRYFTSDEREVETLDDWLSPAGGDDLYEYCHRPRRTIHEVMSEFRNVRVPKDYIFDLLPPLRPRQFSIASSNKENPKIVQLCVAVVKYRTTLKVPRRGACTTYLAGLKPGDKLRVAIQKGMIALPPSPSIPVICVGPGTGVAPMRALIQERIHDGSSSNTLYFGCRSATQDEHYAAEWAALAARQQLVYRVAHSRDGKEGEARVYVQDRIREDAKRVWELLRSGAWVYISGSSNKMPAGVKAALADVVEREGGYARHEAVRYVDGMIREGRFFEECWS